MVRYGRLTTITICLVILCGIDGYGRILGDTFKDKHRSPPYSLKPSSNGGYCRYPVELKQNTEERVSLQHHRRKRCFTIPNRVLLTSESCWWEIWLGIYMNLRFGTVFPTKLFRTSISSKKSTQQWALTINILLPNGMQRNCCFHRFFKVCNYFLPKLKQAVRNIHSL